MLHYAVCNLYHTFGNAVAYDIQRVVLSRSTWIHNVGTLDINCLQSGGR